MKRIKRHLNLEQYSFRLLALRPRSEKEIREKFQRKNYPKEEIDKTVSRLKKQNLINDREFAGIWVKNRSLLKPKGKRILAMELRQKGIGREIIDEVLNYNEETETALAKEALNSKIKIYAGLDSFERKQKSIAFLSRRGFSYGIAKKVVEQNEKKW